MRLSASESNGRFPKSGRPASLVRRYPRRVTIAEEVTTAAPTDPLLVAVVSVLLTLLVGLIAGMVTRRGEHTKWLRDKRLAAYADYLNVMRQSMIQAAQDPNLAITESVTKASTMMALVGPRAVGKAAEELSEYMIANLVGEHGLTVKQKTAHLAKLSELDDALVGHMVKALGIKHYW